MRRRKLLATLALLGAMISAGLVGGAAQANADVPRIDVPVNRGW